MNQKTIMKNSSWRNYLDVFTGGKERGDKGTQVPNAHVGQRYVSDSLNSMTDALGRPPPFAALQSHWGLSPKLKAIARTHLDLDVHTCAPSRCDKVLEILLRAIAHDLPQLGQQDAGRFLVICAWP
jgi:hypothetical protein